MNLVEGTDIFLRRLRVDGREHENVRNILRRLVREEGDIPLTEIKQSHILRFLEGPRTLSPITWQVKYSALRKFFEFWTLRGELVQSCLPHPRVFAKQLYVPHIFTRQEILSLLRAIKGQSKRCIHPETMRAFILTLYGTGALTGELRCLSSEKLDLRAGFMEIGEEKLGRARRIPLNRDLVAALRQYSSWKKENGLVGPYFFLRRDSRPLDKYSIDRFFDRTRLNAKVTRHDGGSSLPRMRDLRATFAVHRITSWIKSGVDLSRMLPSLSAYMGQVQLTSSEVFLGMTPERFRKELNSLSPKRSRKHWRDDSGLINFLTRL